MRKFPPKLKTISLFFVMFLFLPFAAFSTEVDQQTAKSVAENYIQHIIATNGQWAGSTSPEIIKEELIIYRNMPVAYNFSVDPGGHLLVAYRDEFSPVLLHSTTSGFKPERVDEPSTIEAWIIPEIYNAYMDMIGNKEALEERIVYSETKVAKAWDWLREEPSRFSPQDAGDDTRSAIVGPLLTTTWAQGSPYNDQTPGIAGSCTHTLVGCVATAWSQLLKYWNWPDRGTGSYSYTWNSQTLSANFDHTYNWLDMPNSLTGSSPAAQIDAVATLCSEVGIAAHMNYGCGSSGSGAYADEKLDVYFKYKASMVRRNRSGGYTDTQWFNFVKNEIDASPPRPVVLSIWNTGGGGHETVIDGYDDGVTDKVHINYGWSGSWDGYYDVTSNWTTGGYTWVANSQIIVTNIEPDGTPAIGKVISLWDVTDPGCGGSARLWARVRNDGLYAFPSDVRVWYYVNGPGWTGSHWVGSQSVGGLAAGSYSWYSLDWTTPATADGTYTYWAILWRDTAVSEWSAAKNFTISCNQASAQVQSLWPVSGAVCEQGSTLWARVHNDGTAALPANTRVWFYVTGPDWSGSNWVGYANAGGLAADATLWYHVTWNIPTGVTPGTYKYWARVYDASNNALSDWSTSQSFTVACGGEVQVLSLWDVSGANCDQSSTLWARIENTGSSDLSANARVWFYVDGPDWDGSHWVGYDPVPNFAGNAIGWCSINWAIPATVTGGTYRYWARAYDGNTALGPWSTSRQFAVNCCAQGGFDEQFNGTTAPNWVQDAGTWYINEGWYRSSGAAGTASTATYNTNYTNFDYTAKLFRYGSDTSANYIVARASGAATGGVPANCYVFMYSRGGSFSVAKYVGGTPTTLKGWTGSSAIAQGSASNILRVVANGTSLTYYINGTQVWSGTDTSLSSGKAGVGLYGADQFYVDYATLICTQ